MEIIIKYPAKIKHKYNMKNFRVQKNAKLRYMYSHIIFNDDV